MQFPRLVRRRRLPCCSNGSFHVSPGPYKERVGAPQGRIDSGRASWLLDGQPPEALVWGCELGGTCYTHKTNLQSLFALLEHNNGPVGWMKPKLRNRPRSELGWKDWSLEPKRACSSATVSPSFHEAPLKACSVNSRKKCYCLSRCKTNLFGSF